MKAKSTSNTLFYQNLGKLFYAFAAIDNDVRKEELEKLIELVNTKWESVEGFNQETANTIVNTFTWLHKNNDYNAQSCYKSFIDYFHKNTSLFNQSLKTLILKTAGKITASFSGQNKSEVILLAKLNLEFKAYET